MKNRLFAVGAGAMLALTGLQSPALAATPDYHPGANWIDCTEPTPLSASARVLVRGSKSWAVDTSSLSAHTTWNGSQGKAKAGTMVSSWKEVLDYKEKWSESYSVTCAHHLNGQPKKVTKSGETIYYGERFKTFTFKRNVNFSVYDETSFEEVCKVNPAKPQGFQCVETSEPVIGAASSGETPDDWSVSSTEDPEEED
jgi:hypothetical protein